MEDVARAYESQLARYIALFGTIARVDSEDLALIDRHLTIWPGCVLDVGCGPGHLTAHLRSLGVDATGIDVVPGFVAHARAAHQLGRYVLGSMEQLPVADRSVTGILAWYSLIHLPPKDLAGVLAELRRVMVPAGTLVVGLFEGVEVAAFEHKIATAWLWPADEFSAQLRSVGFTEIERAHRPARDGHRPHASLVATSD